MTGESTNLRKMEEEAPPSTEPMGSESVPTGRRRSRTRWLALLVLVAAASAAGVVTWLVVRSHHHGGHRAPAEAVSIRQLNELAASVGHPVYWAGLQPKDTYELTKTKDGRIYIRYLPP